MRNTVNTIVSALIVAASGTPALAQESPGMVVVRDPQTGELRAPTTTELRALRAVQRPVQTEQAVPAGSVVRPDGTRSLKLGERGMTYATVTRGADGKLVEHCVAGASPAFDTSAREHDHAHE